MGNAQRKEKDAADKISAKASKPDKTKKDGRRTLQEEFESGDDIQSSFETIQKDEITGLDANGELSTAGASEAIGDSNQGKQNVMFHDLVQQLDSFSIPIKSVPPSSNSAIDGQELEKLEGSSLPPSFSGELSAPSPSSTACQGESAAHSLEAQKVVYDTTKESEEALKQAPSAQVEHGDQSGVVPMSQEAVQEGTDPVSDKSIPEPQEKQDPPIPKPHIDISEGARNNEAAQESTPKPEGEGSIIADDVQPRQVIENEPAEGLKDEVDQEFREAVLMNEHAAILDPAVDNRKVELAGVSVPPEEAPLPSDIITEDVASDGPSEAINEKLTDSNFELSEGPEIFKEENLHSEAESKKEDSQDSNSADTDAFEDPKTAADSSAVVKDQEETSWMVEDEQHAPVVAEEEPIALASNEMAPSDNGDRDAKSSLDTAELVDDHPSESAGSADSEDLGTSKDPVVKAEVPTIQATETADETEADEKSTVATENDEPIATVRQDTKEDTIPLENAERKEQDTEEPIADSFVPEDASKQIVEKTNHQTTGSVTEENVEDLSQPVAANEPPADESTEDGNVEEGTREDASAAVEINEGEEVTDKAVDVFSPIEGSSKNTEEPTDLHDSIAANDRLFPAEDKEDSIDAVEINEDTSKDQNEPTVLEEDLQETLDDSVVTDNSMASTVEETSDNIGSITDKEAAPIGAGEPNTEDSIASTGSDAEAAKDDTTDAVEINQTGAEDPSKDQNEPAVVEEDPQEPLDGSVVADDPMVEETSDQIGPITDKAPAPIGAEDEDSILASTGSDAEATKEDTTDAVEITETENPVQTPSKDQNEPAGVEEDPQEPLDGSVVADDSMVEETSDQIGPITDKAPAPIGAGDEDSILASTGSDAEATKEDTADAVEINETEVPVEDPSKDQNEPAVVEEVPQETLDGSVVPDDSMASAVEETSDHIGSITGPIGAADEDSMLASIGSDAEATKEDAVAEKESVCTVNEEAPDKTSDVLATVDTQEPVDSSRVEEGSREIHAGNDAASEPVHSTVEEMNHQSTGVLKDEANVADSTTEEPRELLATEEPATSAEVRNNTDDASIRTIAEEEPAAIEESSLIKAEDTSGNITDDAGPKEDLEETKEAATQLNEQINKDLMIGERTSEERQNDEVVANVDVPELIEMQESVEGINGEVEKESKEPAEVSDAKNVDSTTEEPNTNEDHEVKNKDEVSLEEPRIDESTEGVAATTEATGEEPKQSEADEIDTGAISLSAAGEDSNETVEKPEPTTTQETFEETKAEVGNEGPTVDSFSAEDGPISEDVPTTEDAALVPREMINEELPTVEDQATTKDLTSIEVENATEKSEEPGAVENTTDATIEEPIQLKDEEVFTAVDASLVPKEANGMHNEDQPHIEVENATEKSEEPGAVEDPKENEQESTSMENAHEDACGKSDDSVTINDTTENTEMNSQPAELEHGTSTTSSSQGENT